MTNQPFMPRSTTGATGTTGPNKNPYADLGPGFRGVGLSGNEKNPKPKAKDSDTPILLDDNVTIQYKGKKYLPGDRGYTDLYIQIELSGGLEETDPTDSDTFKFQAGLLRNDPKAIRVRQLMIQNGIISSSAKLGTVVSAYQDLLGDLADFKSVGQVFTMEQLISQYGAFNSALPGTGGTKQTGPVSSVTEVDYGTNKVGDKSQGARQARKQLQEYFRETIGRAGTEEEVEAMRVALVTAAARSKPVTTTSRVGGKTVTKVTPGFDIKSWASGYIATKFADEDVAGSLGQAQDQLRLLARAYGVDMGETWYATAAKRVGKGMSVEDFTDEIKQVAIGRYPGLADRINKGSNVFQIASPYIQAKAKVLEMDPDAIDIDDMDIQQAIGFKDATGNFSSKPLWQFETDLRKKPEWQYTKNAKSSYDSVLLKVLRDFGMMG
jgi:hypothetical protein